MATFLGAWQVDLFVAANLLLAAAWYLWAVRRVNAADPALGGTGASPPRS